MMSVQNCAASEAGVLSYLTMVRENYALDLTA
jgi:hypothetical protein